uniref:ATP synthase F0 subunit 6 n=1 Tax=Taenia tianguangfui TaxID=1548223 RepID=A0A8K1V724_9CEST|nr:ATP synthase F0 subunit 6 [Taenia tianguangfui]
MSSIIYNDFSSLFSKINNSIFGMVSYYYFKVLSVVLFLFLCYRFPYCYSPYFFVVFLILVVFSSFVSLFLARVLDNVHVFFSSFIPVGTPIFICPLVCVAEVISYIIRPIVLILRPFINISLGCFGAIAIGNLSLFSWYWCIIIFLLFFYEVFVALVHWFIVASILEFSVDH